MKRLFAILAAALIIALLAVPAAALTSTNTTAAYATVCPVIDGDIDEIWNYTEAQNVPDIGDITNSYTKLLWNEKGLYLLAYVEDASVTTDDADARNSVDFWVSEKNTQDVGYDADPGDWHFCKASDGTECYYTGNAKVYDVAERTVKTTGKGYIVEMFVPYLSDLKAAEGTVIGYTVSINDDNDDDGVRNEYTFWATSDDDGAYWENTLALCDLTFKAGPDASVFAPAAEEAPATAEAAPAVIAPATADTVAVAAAVAVLGAAVVVCSKKH